MDAKRKSYGYDGRNSRQTLSTGKMMRRLRHSLQKFFVKRLLTVRDLYTVWDTLFIHTVTQDVFCLKKKQVSLFQITLNLKRNLKLYCSVERSYTLGVFAEVKIIIRLCVRTLICIRALFIKCSAYLPKCIHRFSLFQELSAGAHIDLKKLSAAAELSDRRISRWYTVRNTRK